MNRFSDEDIIAAISTAVGSAGIGIVRLSGQGCIPLVDTLFKNQAHKKLKDAPTQTMVYGNMVNPTTHQILDEVLVSVMRGPHTYTTQDVVEINGHGGALSMEAILNTVLAAGARLAEPGEFTKRAFLGGRIDLTQAESIMDIIGAKTQRSLSLSLHQLKGELSSRLSRIDGDLISLLSDMEAAIDYPEYDIEEKSTPQTREAIGDALTQVEALIASADSGKIYREGIATAIIGSPNVGKSSLLNGLIHQEKAIVTDIPGTTRDIVEEYINLEGIPFKIVDTAGIRETEDTVEKIGVARSLGMIEEASLILMMVDVSRETSEEEKTILKNLAHKNVIFIANKMDLKQHPEFTPMDNMVSISLKTNEGVADLKKKMVDMVRGGNEGEGNETIIANLRQRDLLMEAKKHLANAITTLDSGMPPEIITIDIKNALDSIRYITGAAIGDDIVDAIFSKFCLGK